VPTTTRRVHSWPTLDRVREIRDAIDNASEVLERATLDSYGLLNEEDPFEPPNVAPEAENVAALSALVGLLDDEIGQWQRWCDDLAKRRDAAAHHVLYKTPLREDDDA